MTRTYEMETSAELATTATNEIEESARRIDSDSRVVELIQQVNERISHGRALTQDLKNISQLLVEQAVRVGNALAHLRDMRNDVAREVGLRPQTFELFVRNRLDIAWTTARRYMDVAQKYAQHLEVDDEGLESLPPVDQWSELGLPDSLTTAYKMVNRERTPQKNPPIRRLMGPPAYIKSAAMLTADLTKQLEIQPIEEMDDGERQQMRDALAPIGKVIEMLG